MSVYNDFMVKASVGLVGLADHYGRQLQLGKDCCCTREKMILLAMYLDTLPRVSNGNCLTSDQVSIIANHISVLLGTYVGTINGTHIPSMHGTVPGNITSGGTTTSYAWNTTIGLSPTRIAFPTNLGTSGNSYGITYILISKDGYVLTDVSITARDKTGFTVTAFEDDAHFEGIAQLI